MFYFFERESAFVRCELRPVPGASTFEIIILEPNQFERVESYPTWEAANARWDEIQARFRQDGWHGPIGRE